jgi:hypothetical protein
MANRRSRKRRSKRTLKPLVRKIKDDISAVQKANLRRLTKALDALGRDVQRLDAKMKICGYTLNVALKAK